MTIDCPEVLPLTLAPPVEKSTNALSKDKLVCLVTLSLPLEIEPTGNFCILCPGTSKNPVPNCKLAFSGRLTLLPLETRPPPVTCLEEGVVPPVKKSTDSNLLPVEGS